MAWSSLDPSSRIQVLLDLVGGPRYRAQMAAAAETTRGFGRATNSAAAATASLNERTFIHNQLLYTTRRLLFYTTLGFVALGAEALRMGFSYNTALQTTRVALQPVIRDQGVLNDEIGKLYTLAALSPFLFKDTVVAFRQMYAAFKPLGFSLEFTNQTINSIVNSLAYAGKTTPAAFNRVAVALQHMAFVGRPMGQMITQLGRDGLPIFAALTTVLGLTGDQIHNIATSGITAQQVIQALNKYIAITPGYANAAANQSRKTLLGAWRQFQDIISQAMGRSSGGIFQGLTRIFAQVDRYLEPMFKARKPISLYNIAQAFDSAVSPKTHIVLNLFTLLDTMIRQVVFDFYLMAAVLALPATAFGILTGAGHANIFMMKVLGGVLGVLLTVWLLQKGAMIAVALWEEVLVLRKFAMITVTKAFLLWQILSVAWRVREAEVLGVVNTETGVNILLTNGARIATSRFGAALIRLVIFMRTGLIPWIARSTAAVVELAAGLGIAEVIAFWPLALIPIFAVLYWRVKQFRDLVKDTVHYLTHPFNMHSGLLGILTDAARGAMTSLPGGAGAINYVGGVVGGAAGATHHVSAGSRVGARTVTRASGAALGGSLNLGITVHPQDIKLDGRTIGQVMSTVTTNAEARQ